MQIIECVQGTEQWAAARRGKATTSRFGTDIITPKTMKMSASAFAYACELVAEELVPPHYWIGDDYQSPAMRHGTACEDEARRYFELETNQDVQRVGFIVSDCGRWGCSPDGLVGENSGLELKCPLHKTQIKWLLNGGVPDEYRWQVYGSMLVTQRDHWWFMSYAPGLPPLLVEVHADALMLKLAEALESFWKLYTELRARIVGAGDPVAATRPVADTHF